MKAPAALAVCFRTLFALALAMPAAAQESASPDELETLKRRLAALESRQQDASGFTLPAQLGFSGLIETELRDTRRRAAGEVEETSDLALSSVALTLEARPADWIVGSATLLWEEDATEPVDLDVATIRLGNPERFPLTGEIGRFYLPFGRYESNFITDPVTLELGEARESAARLACQRGPCQAGIAVFNGSVAETGASDDRLADFVVDSSLEWSWEHGSFALGAAYIGNLADSDSLQDAVADNASGGTLADRVAGAACWTSLTVHRATLSLGYVAALADFAPNSLSFNGAGNDWAASARPRAIALELACGLSDRLTLAARAEHTRAAYEWLPERRYGVCASYLLHRGERSSLTCTLEYLHGKYDDADRTREDSVGFQVALAF